MQQQSAPGPLALELTQLVVGHASSAEEAVLHDLSFALTGPGLLAVVGHNGSGKSTLLRTLAGELPARGGSARLSGQPITATATADGRVSWLPQRTDVRFPIPVIELVVLGRYRSKRWYETWAVADYAAARQALTECGVGHLADRDFTTLSGGEQQLVWLAQAHLQHAQLYLLDEPTQQLDVYHRRRVFDLLSHWVLQAQRLVVCITHDLDQLAVAATVTPGWLLNLSGPKPPVLQALTPARIDAARRELESTPPRLQQVIR